MWKNRGNDRSKLWGGLNRDRDFLTINRATLLVTCRLLMFLSCHFNASIKIQKGVQQYSGIVCYWISQTSCAALWVPVHNMWVGHSPRAVLLWLYWQCCCWLGGGCGLASAFNGKCAYWQDLQVRNISNSHKNVLKENCIREDYKHTKKEENRLRIYIH